MSNTRWGAVVAMIVIAAASRLLPHPPNVTPIAALALFGGALLTDRRFAYGVPLAALFLSDLVLGFHSQMPTVYLSFLATVALGRRLQTRRSVLPVAATTLASSLLFFIVTNFGVWLWDALYPRTAAGLAACYVAAIPFFQYSLVGDLLYVTVFFGGFSLLERLVPHLGTFLAAKNHCH